MMDSDRSQKLEALAKQLRLYKPSLSLSLSSIEDHSPPITQPPNLVSQSSDQTRSKVKRAAVLVCLFEGDEGEIRVILTKRASILSSHSGEVSLPGGKREEGDADDIETALREAEEEIGLDRSLVAVVNVLEPFTQKRGVTVVPVVGILSDQKSFNPTPNPAEVEAIFDVPLEMFLKDENRKEEEREWMGEKYLLHYFEYEADHGNKYIIWALTAGFLIRTASIVYQRPPAFAVREPHFWYKVAQ